jgi:hypothetical protein
MFRELTFQVGSARLVRRFCYEKEPTVPVAGDVNFPLRVYSCVRSLRRLADGRVRGGRPGRSSRGFFRQQLAVTPEPLELQSAGSNQRRAKVPFFRPD